jgi:hypothetical protein
MREDRLNPGPESVLLYKISNTRLSHCSFHDLLHRRPQFALPLKYPAWTVSRPNTVCCSRLSSGERSRNHGASDRPGTQNPDGRRHPDCGASYGPLIEGPGWLIPIPASNGSVSANLKLAKAIAEFVTTARVICAVARVHPVESAYRRRLRGLPGLTVEEHESIRVAGPLEPLPAYFVDNVITTGTTVAACRRAFGWGSVSHTLTRVRFTTPRLDQICEMALTPCSPSRAFLAVRVIHSFDSPHLNHLVLSIADFLMNVFSVP